MLEPQRVKIGIAPGLRIVAQQQAEHRREVALTGPEAAVDVCRLAVAVADGRLRVAERPVQALRDVRCDGVALDDLFGAIGAFGELDDVAALRDLLRKIEELGRMLMGTPELMLGRYASPAAYAIPSSSATPRNLGSTVQSSNRPTAADARR